MVEKRYLWGTAYNRLISASAVAMINISAARELSINAQHILENHQHSRKPLTYMEREIVYNDPAMRLTAAEVQEFQHLQKVPVWDNHSKRAVGSIIDGFIVDNSTIKVLAEIDDPTVIGKIDSGEYRGLSVGYGRTKIGNNMDGIEFYEVSVCPEPFFDGCTIGISASKEKIEVKFIIYNFLVALGFIYSCVGSKSFFNHFNHGNTGSFDRHHQCPQCKYFSLCPCPRPCPWSSNSDSANWDSSGLRGSQN